MFSAFRIQWNELVIILQYFARVSAQMGNPGHDAAGALLDIWAEVGNTGRGYIIDYICEFTNLANFSTLVRLPFYDVRLHRAVEPGRTFFLKTENGYWNSDDVIPFLLFSRNVDGSFFNCFEFKLCRSFSGIERWNLSKEFFLRVVKEMMG